MFQLLEWTESTIKSVTPREEKHGKESVSAISIGLMINAPNLLMDSLSPTLRDGVYAANEDQDDVPGVPRVTPNLRAPELAGLMIPLDTLLEGATAYFDYGADGENDPITLGSAKVDKVKVEPLASGWSNYYLRIGTSDISRDEFGIFCDQLGHKMRVRIEPPAAENERVETDLVIDGTSGHPGAPLFEEPSAARLTAEEAFAGGTPFDEPGILDDVGEA